MIFRSPLVTFAFGCLASLVAISISENASAHEGHSHAGQDGHLAKAESPAEGTTLVASQVAKGEGVETAFVEGQPIENGVTGSGDLKFRYHAELSKLPAEVAKGIIAAHGGFGKAPNGDIYFGLNGTGLIRMSADLKTKTLVSSSESLLKGGLHNCTYVDREGGILVLPDNDTGRVLMVGLDGSEVKTLGRPDFLSEGAYRPTDADVADDNHLYVCDGYGSSKSVFTIDLESKEYGEYKFGGPAKRAQGKDREGAKFTTNHGILFDSKDGTLLIADRENQWAQRLKTDGEFIEGYDMDQSSPCDIDFVKFNGERLMVVGCLRGANGAVVQILRDGKIVSTLNPLKELGLNQFTHIHNAAAVVVDGKLYVLCYGWNPGCFAVLEHIAK